MKTYLFTLAMLLSLPFVGSAQNATCGADAAHRNLLKEHPEIIQDEIDLEQFTKDFAANYSHYNINRAGNIVIPIVFHILHQGGSENISDAQVLDEMRILNEDYNKRNADKSTVIPSFQSLVADIGIEFRLANLDPNGNPTNGIERIHTCQTFSGDDYSKFNSWPRDKYINIWVVNNMMAGAAGYAYYPGSVQALYSTPSRDGINILHPYVGSIGTGNYSFARAITHEIGHYLNLKHVWGDNNDPGQACGDDDVSDTPITKGWSNCPSPANAKKCDTAIIENYQNFMEYSYCSRMFTEGQKIRMIAALNSNKSDRNNLWTPENLAATGVDDTTYLPSVPVAGFGVSKRYVCVGGSVTLKDASWNGTVTDYLWEIPGGSPATSTDKNPIIQFLTTGWQPIKLTVSNAEGSSSKADTFLVYVGSDIASYQAPFIQGFEDANILSYNEWVTANYDENFTQFKQVNTTSHSGNGSVGLNNYYARANHDIDEIISPGFDLSGLSSTSSPSQMQLSFYYSWASASTDFTDFFDDSLVVYATINCGTTWIPIYNKGTKNGSADLLNAGSVQGYFTPTRDVAFWKYVKINLANTYKVPNVRFKFRVYSAVRGNNFYLDDINIGNLSTGIENISVVNNATIFPNPTEGDATLNLSLAAAGKVTVNVVDITGKEVAKIFDGMLNDGDTQLPIQGSQLLSAGVYIVNIKAGESVVQKKLVIN